MLHPWAVAAVWLLAAWFVFTGVRIGVVGYSATPFYDQWSWLLPDELLHNLFAQHNEHRIVLTRLLLLLDAWGGGAQGIVPTVAMYLFQGAHAVLLYLLTTRAFDITGAFRRAVVALAAAAFAFAGFQFENFTSGFQSQFTGVFLFATASFAALSIYARGRKPLWLAAAFAAATVSAGCMANGVLAPALLPVLGVLLRVQARDLAILAVGAGAILILYLQGYVTPGGHGDPMARLSHLPQTMAFLFGYLGGAAPNSLRAAFALGEHGGPIVQATGAVGFVLALFIMLDAVRTRNAWKVSIAGVLAFVLATAGLTALGRAGLDQSGMFSNRYGAATAPFWSIICAWFVAVGAHLPGRLRWSGLALALALALAVATAQKTFTGAALEFAWRKREAGAALMANANVAETLTAAHPSADYVRERAQLLREAELATFAQPWSRLLGASAPTATALCEEATLAGASVASSPAWRLSIRGRIDARAIAFVADGRVVGLGVRRMRDDADLPRPFGNGRARPVWSGFANLPERTRVTAIAISVSGQGVCRIKDGFDAGGAGP